MERVTQNRTMKAVKTSSLLFLTLTVKSMG